MKNSEYPTAIKTIRCLIGQADILRQKGKLLKAAKILKKTDILIKAALKSTPENKILLTMKTKHEKCWNKTIDTIARSKL
ncbi:MAG: hypothetical protein EA393_13970 [Bacteroidetes bacterium]|nr:MAG: hypothetical protein EA393_13970 [Bacteroidota bacterium]